MRLCDAGQFRIEADRHPRRNRPQSCEQQRKIHAQKSCAQTKSGLMQFSLLQSAENDCDSNHTVANRNQSRHHQRA